MLECNEKATTVRLGRRDVVSSTFFHVEAKDLSRVPRV